jgi:CDP-paratose 2-epimerase
MRVLVTGGAGFIGSNLAHDLLNRGYEVLIFDNLLRPGTKHNLAWLQREHTAGLTFTQGDVRDFDAVKEAMRGIQIVYHLAAQVAVTASLADPVTDFEINARGTLNVLEAARRLNSPPIVLFASTNKVYGKMADIPIVELDQRYAFRDLPAGINESRPLDFHSPYGCSKGAADQYVRDYARTYGLRTVVFRLSCIYGPHQFGNEDQGWVAHFVRYGILGKTITIYGNGKQVRDILWVGDLVRAFVAAVEHIDTAAGQVYNIGGGPANTVSIWGEFSRILAELAGREIPVRYDAWRPGDQYIYISDTSKAGHDFGWQPTVSKMEGIRRLWEWIMENQNLLRGNLW